MRIMLLVGFTILMLGIVAVFGISRLNTREGNRTAERLKIAITAREEMTEVNDPIIDQHLSSIKDMISNKELQSLYDDYGILKGYHEAIEYELLVRLGFVSEGQYS